MVVLIQGGREEKGGCKGRVLFRVCDATVWWWDSAHRGSFSWDVDPLGSLLFCFADATRRQPWSQTREREKECEKERGRVLEKGRKRCSEASCSVSPEHPVDGPVVSRHGGYATGLGSGTPDGRAEGGRRNRAGTRGHDAWTAGGNKLFGKPDTTLDFGGEFKTLKL